MRPATTVTGPVLPQLVRLALPVIGLNILQVLALAVDTAMVGRLSGASVALTGMGFATQLSFLLMVLMIGLTVGSVAFVARAHGAGDPERVSHIFGQSATLAAALGLFVAIGGNLVAAPLLTLLGASADDLDAALAYLRPSLLFAPATYLSILLAAVLRAVGNTRLAFFVALGSNSLNVGLNYLLILGGPGIPALGLVGAALGTGLSQLAAVVALWVLLARGAEPALRGPPRLSRIDRSLMTDLVRVGAPAAVDMVVLNAGFLSIVGMLGRLDPLAVAAHGVGLRVQALAFVPGMSISQAIGAMVGQALGANNVSRARLVLRYGAGLNAAVMSSLAAIIIFGRVPILALFDIEATSPLGTYAQEWMQLLGWCMPSVGIFIAFVGLFRGAGATRIPLRINALLTLLVQVPLSWFLGFGLGMGTFGVWLALPLSFVGKVLLGGVYVAREDWATTGSRV